MTAKLESFRFYGDPPFRVAVIHGGPGAAGQMAPVARRLSRRQGVLEPLQTVPSVEEQINELRDVLTAHGDIPATLIGSSWGAWLALLTAARHPECAEKLILVGSGPLEERYASGILETRLGRLDPETRKEVLELMEKLDVPSGEDKDSLLSRLGEIFTRIDAYDPITLDMETVAVQHDIHIRVWKEAAVMRRSGALLREAEKVQCPVVAIHGDYDPHPSEGVQRPLSGALNDFRLVLLQRCGHQPWIERQAQDPFFDILEDELTIQPSD